MKENRANPLLAASPLPFGAPAFDQIQKSDYLPAFRQAIDRARAQIRAITDNPEAPSFANTIEALERSGNPGRGVHAPALFAAETVYVARERIANLLGAGDPARIVFTMNATQALNTAIKGLIRPGDHVVTTVLEHNSVLRPLYEMRERGTALTIAGCDEYGNVDYDQVEKAAGKETRAIVCTHASNLTGNVVNLARMREIADRCGCLLIVDASQTAGALPTDVLASGIDVLCFTGHKSLLGPQGTGGLYVREGLKVRPLLSGGSGFASFSEKHPEIMPDFSALADDLNHWKEINAIESEQFISIPNIDSYPAFNAVIHYQNKCPILNSSGWFLPSIHHIKRIFDLYMPCGDLWTSSQADRDHAIVYDRLYHKFEIKEKYAEYNVLPIAAF